MAGRPAKPVEVLTLENNTAKKTKAELKRRANNEEAMMVSEFDKFVAPDNLQGKTRDVFYETKKMLNKMGILHNADIRLVADYARMVVKSDDLYDIAQGMQDAMMDTKGKVYANPIIAEWRRTQAQVVKLASELGFTPTSRAALANKMIEDKKKAQEVDEFDD